MLNKKQKVNLEQLEEMFEEFDNIDELEEEIYIAS